MQYIFSLQEINAVAAQFWNDYKSHKVFAFYAPMGSGKTTFIRALCEVLQVKDDISSPTFSIINEYQSASAGIIYHTDLYRLKDEEEAIQAGVEACLQSGNICLIEWPEIMEAGLPLNTLQVYIETVDANTRKISVQK